MLIEVSDNGIGIEEDSLIVFSKDFTELIKMF